jgi:hypothetical protein
MSETLEKVENIIKRTNKINVENALSEDSPLMKLLMESVEMNMKVLDTLPDLDEDEMKANLIKLLVHKKVRNLKITTEIRFKTAKMIDKFFKTKKKANSSFKFKKMIDKFFKIKKNANSSNKTKKMVGGDPHEECPICFETNVGVESHNLVCCPSQPQHHVFHRDCALSWLRLRGKCPSCRAIWNPFVDLINPREDDIYPRYFQNDHNDYIGEEDVVRPVEEGEEEDEEEERGFWLSLRNEINSTNFSREFHLGITTFLIILLACLMFSRRHTISYYPLPLYSNVILYFINSLPFTYNNDVDPIITIYRVQQFIYIFCIIHLLFFVTEMNSGTRVRETARRLQQVTDLILENSSDVDESLRQMFRDLIAQADRQLNEHQYGGSMKARRKSRKKRGRKSNRKKLDRKKLNRKTRRKVMKF